MNGRHSSALPLPPFVRRRVLIARMSLKQDYLRRASAAIFSDEGLDQLQSFGCHQVGFLVSPVSDRYDIDFHTALDDLIHDSKLADLELPEPLQIGAKWLAVCGRIGREFFADGPDQTLLLGFVDRAEVFVEYPGVQNDGVHRINGVRRAAPLLRGRRSFVHVAMPGVWPRGRGRGLPDAP